MGHDGTAKKLQTNINIYQQSKYQLDPSTCSRDIDKNFNEKLKHLSNANSDADAGLIAIAFPVLSYR